jgi:hypothetical protein
MYILPPVRGDLAFFLIGMKTGKNEKMKGRKGIREKEMIRMEALKGCMK